MLTAAIPLVRIVIALSAILVATGAMGCASVHPREVGVFSHREIGHEIQARGTITEVRKRGTVLNIDGREVLLVDIHPPLSARDGEVIVSGVLRQVPDFRVLEREEGEIRAGLAPGDYGPEWTLDDAVWWVPVRQ